MLSYCSMPATVLVNLTPKIESGIQNSYATENRPAIESLFPNPVLSDVDVTSTRSRDDSLFAYLSCAQSHKGRSIRYDTLLYLYGIYLHPLHCIIPVLHLDFTAVTEVSTVENTTLRSSLISTMANRDSSPDSVLRPNSRRRISEPDLTIVVGGREFLHHSVLLCLASEYFDRMLSSDTRESRTRRIEFPDGDPEEWVRFCRYLEPRSLFTATTFPVDEEDAEGLLPWFHLFGMTNLLQECDERLSISSPKFLDDGLNDSDYLRSTMTDILVWAETATTYGLSETLDTMMKELNKAVNDFPEIITMEILESMRPFWSAAVVTELWEAVKAKLPDDVKSSHNGNDVALKANKQLIELLAQSCKVPAQIRILKCEADFNAIVNLMKKYRSCPRIQQSGCVAFRDRILQNDDPSILSAVKDGIGVIVSAMTVHNNVAKVQEQGCAALGNLACNNDDNCILIAAKLGIEAIVCAMTAHSNVSKVQECTALGGLACNNENSVSIAAKNGIEAILSAMTVHSNIPEVQEWGCAALVNLAYNDVNRLSIAGKHGIEAIVSAMTAHSNVQEDGCAALGNLAHKNYANCVSITAKHGIEAILSAMTAHSNVSNVQECGCAALGNLAYNDANRLSILGELGVEAIVRAMAAHTNVSRVQKRGCIALAKLARNNDARCASIVAKYGIEAIVSAMTAHTNVSNVQEWGCRALGNLARKNDANCVSIAAKDAIEAIVIAMTAHSNVAKVQKGGCWALFHLTFNKYVAVKIQHEGGMAVLEQNPSNSNAEKALQRIKALTNPA
jgi:hypothetical protein